MEQKDERLGRRNPFQTSLQFWEMERGSGPKREEKEAQKNTQCGKER